ncbi:MAG: isoprenyl transferase [Alphaproteobacteria bacterium]
MHDAMSSSLTQTDEEQRMLPRHVAFIMDGNGRWAQQRGLPRIAGHRAGVESLRKTIGHALKLKLEYLTLFSFSSENWSRPASEVDAIMGLLRRFVRSDLAELNAKNVRIRIIGSRDNLPADILNYLVEAENTTEANTGMTLIVAFNYGARDEICRATQKIAHRVAKGELRPDEIDEALLSLELDTSGLPDPDLLIRTSGESRLSNFLLWQSAYTEFVFLDVFWPDFAEGDFDQALEHFAKRDRRYGNVCSTQSVV